jgi:hypothetical protein
MTDETPTQRASRELAEAAFSDPELRQRFELMTKETANREPVPDDFAWLPQHVEQSEFSRFKALTQKLLQVPKSAIKKP